MWVRVSMSDPSPLHLYLVKNLRGVLYFSMGASIEAELSWLKRKFKYRELGVSDTLGVEAGWSRLLSLPRIVDDVALDSLLQASRFVCPLVALKEESLGDFGGAVVASLKTSDKLGDKDLKFNLRLTNYAITDFYLKSIELAEKGNMEGRRKLAEKDLKRFWRVKPDPTGKTLIAYIDPLLIKGDIQSPTQKSLIPCFILDLE
ncbi:MAG: hypothetical protein KIH01_03365 [Candidatus Freyarchaeota archaeon]|nr:hypothetical protein [Candidatus Jordarchaeia archaeon]